MKKNQIYLFILNIVIFIRPLSVFAECTDYCKEVAPAVRLVKIGLIPVLQIVIPIALILMAMLDLLKAVVAGREEEMKKAQSMLIKRAIYAIGLFFVMTIVHLSFDLFKITGADSEVEGTQEWWQCYSSVDECQDDEFITEDERQSMEYVCYACGNSSGRSYYWRQKGSMAATGGHGCYITNQSETECRSHSTYDPSPAPGSDDGDNGTGNDGNGTGESGNDDSGGTATFDNQGYGQIGTFTSATGKTYKNYKQCYNQYGNTGKAAQYGWLCNQGCGLTSAAIIISSVNPNIDPEYIWDNYRQYHQPNGVPVASYFTQYGLTVQSKDDEESGSSTATFTKQELINHLKSGGAAVMRFTASPCNINGEHWTSANHYVAVLGYRQSDDSIYISNPGDAWAKNGWYKADSLLNATTCKVRITHLAK